ncbi:hypothetical protein H2200_012642 [Cladophialophora chaetospira]|uniref:Uncharacterized protein n=1 Tax=Cladophialophora chaetospira TaxID=386627 RepID=A0AA38WXD9_9EURO|nr:hypothetical protein H2200_012642 [Cladophialophora chaetospira]
MPGTEICFIDSGPASKSKKEQAIQRAKALSHAARISHGRKTVKTRDSSKASTPPQRQDGGQGRKDVKSPPQQQTRHSTPPWDPERSGDGSEDEDWKTLLLPAHDPGSDAWSLHEELDPFLRLSGPMTRKERGLLHYCTSL